MNTILVAELEALDIIILHGSLIPNRINFKELQLIRDRYQLSHRAEITTQFRMRFRID